MRIGSLFSGYGGLDLAVASVIEADVAWHVEYDPAPSRILEHHFPGVPNYGDVTTVDWSQVPSVDILTAGYPCQPFSHAGKREGTNDERHLWPYVVTAICELRPRLVVLENVRGHLTLGFADVLGDLAQLGFAAEWGIVRASDAGAPHQRARLFVVAHPEDIRYERIGFTWGWGPGLADGRHDAANTDGNGSRRMPPGLHAGERQQDAQGNCEISWGDYEPAIRQWESVLGRPAPRPTEPGRTGAARLSPQFTEWLMGLPDGWVTGPEIGLSRNEQLRALGNGVVPQQAALALDVLLQRAPDDLRQTLAPL